MLRTAFVCAILLAAPAGGPLAEDTYVQDFETAAGGTDGFLEALTADPGTDWQARVADGAYVLTNTSARGAVRYYDFKRVEPGGTPARQITASVTVGGTFEGEFAAAGLLARYDAETDTYYAFVRTADGVALYKRGPSGFSRLMNLSDPGAATDAPLTLSARRVDEGTTLSVDGRTLGTVSSEDIAGDRFGLVAIGRGSFRFDDFTVTTE